MEPNRPGVKANEISMDQIIAAIRNTRDQQIEELMKDPVLMTFLEHYYNTVAISDVKKAFLRRGLSELKNSSLDLSHYSFLITKMKESNTSIVDNHKLLLSELKTLFQRHGF
jgi:Na+-transporting NADH:ubiquinone oxidoreductase subunit NqrB